MRITQQQLEAYLWGAATLLRGTIDAGDYKQFIFPLLFFKRLCDVYDEETQAALEESGGDAAYAAFPEHHRFQIPPDAHWKAARAVATHVGPALQVALRAIESANPDKLYGIFGDAQWSNTERLSDAMLRDLIEHFSALDLTIANLPEDELGQGYEYLIKKFADDSGHTAAEFYTNRTVVHLMTELLQPQPGESIYDPTCGSGGMLLSCIAHLRRRGLEWRNVRLYGQERNLMTSSIARMNCFLHGIEDFRIERGDTLADPRFVQGDRLMQFDVVLANPPYSIKQWDREAFASDPWGRNLYGTPPQGRADYAFWQHILLSLAPQGGRCAILFPHGVLFRQEEAEMRRKLIEADLIECVLGLGPNLFYNSPMEACVVICRTAKPRARRGRILFLNAVNEVTRERAQSYLIDEHIQRIVQAYAQFADEPGFARVATLEEMRARDGNLSIPLYVAPASSAGLTIAEGSATYHTQRLPQALEAWLSSRQAVAESLRAVLPDMALPAMGETLNDLENVALFDHSNWQSVRLGDVVVNVNETEHDPAAAGLDRFIGLEHLEPGSLHVRAWGQVADGTTFTRRCRPGQVLFGKRRAYQRKVAVAEFDAVVSGDIYLFAPRNERLLPELLPFLCLSERFYQFAVETSAGSLSPRTNWSHLAQFEFALPPLDQQRRIAEMLWAVDEAIEGGEILSKETQTSRVTVVGQMLNDWAGDERTLKTLSEVCDVIVDGTHFTPTYVERGVPFLRVTDIQNDPINWTHVKFIPLEEHAELCKRCSPRKGDVLLSKNGTIGLTRVVTWEEEFSIFVSLCLLRPSSGLQPEYLAEVLRSTYVQRQFTRRAKQGTVTNLHLVEIRECRIPVPAATQQDAFVQSCDRWNRVSSDIRASCGAIVRLEAELLELALRSESEAQQI